MTASDIAQRHWLDRLVPAAAIPYLRLIRADRPIGTYLLLFPCLWSLALAYAAGHGGSGQAAILAFLGAAALFALGSFVMRGAGCVVNDLADRDIDAKVARTQDRPIASGAVSVRQALVFLAALLLVGLLVLVQFNSFTVWLAIASLPLVATYPFMKRITYWPQAFLGITFNWGALVGWASVTGGLDLAPVLLYAAGIAWTLGYDTIYAHQDKEDDALVGVKSSALRLGAGTRPWLYGFYAVTLGLLAAAGLAAGLSWLYFLGLAAGALQLAWQVRTVDLDDPPACLRAFKSNRWFGLDPACGSYRHRVLEWGNGLMNHAKPTAQGTRLHG